MNTQVINTIQVILSIVLIALILLQAKGSGLGSTFGGSLGFYSSKRGFEKLLFRATMLVSILFLISSLIAILL